jgi:putative sigma-54 modulation protein
MRTTIRGKNVTVVEADREYVERKLRRLERILDDRSDATVEFREEHRRNADEGHIVEVSLVIDGALVRGVGTGPTYRAAVDAVVDRLERRTVEHKQRPRDRARSTDGTASADGSTDDAGRVEGPDETAGSGRIVKVKRFAIEPMFEEDAMSRMEELGHAFFVFVNAENERLGVLYRRRDGRFGLIEPVVGGEYTTGRS